MILLSPVLAQSLEWPVIYEITEKGDSFKYFLKNMIGKLAKLLLDGLFFIVIETELRSCYLSIANRIETLDKVSSGYHYGLLYDGTYV